jgi:phosphopantetheinyl transferase (holo-ACP synthase)
VLYGKAAKLAEKEKLTTWSVSLSHTQSHAIAMVVGVG